MFDVAVVVREFDDVPYEMVAVTGSLAVSVMVAPVAVVFDTVAETMRGAVVSVAAVTDTDTLLAMLPPAPVHVRV